MAVSTKRITDLPEKTEVTDEDLIAVGNAGTASLRKTKWSAFWNKILSKIRSDVIVNNKTTTAPGYALDARVGKDIQEQVNDLNTNTVPVYINQTIRVEISANTRTNVHYDYPDDMKSQYRRKMPLACDCGTGFAQGTFTDIGDTYCEILIHNIGSAATKDIKVQFACFK